MLRRTGRILIFDYLTFNFVFSLNTPIKSSGRKTYAHYDQNG